MPTDRLQSEFAVGDIVNVPCVVTAVTAGTQPAVTLTTKYVGFAGTTDSVTGIDAIQVIKDK